MMNNAAKSFDILTAILSVIHNYFNGPTKLFSDLYLAKFLDISTKLFFSRKIVHLGIFNYMFILVTHILHI